MKLGTVSVMADGTNGKQVWEKAGWGKIGARPEKTQAKPEFALELGSIRGHITLFLAEGTEEFLGRLSGTLSCVFRTWLQGRNVNRFILGMPLATCLFPETRTAFCVA